MRALGIDPGTRRVGVALSDEDGAFASPLCTIEVKRREQVLGEIAALAEKHAAQVIVVGLPLRLDGSEGEAARRSRMLAEQLAARTGRSVELWDERLSTRAAERALREGELRGKAARQVVDRVAAALLLQSYLDAHGARRGYDEGEGDG
jgi:putative Holliday junction resolvase